MAKVTRVVLIKEVHYNHMKVELDEQGPQELDSDFHSRCCAAAGMAEASQSLDVEYSHVIDDYSQWQVSTLVD